MCGGRESQEKQQTEDLVLICTVSYHLKKVFCLPENIFMGVFVCEHIEPTVYNKASQKRRGRGGDSYQHIHTIYGFRNANTGPTFFFSL